MEEKLYTLIVNNVYLNTYFKKGKFKRFIVDFIAISKTHTKLILQLNEKNVESIKKEGFENLLLYK